ncbi:hypothetical protein ABIC66_002505 [Caulobacter sp. 1776]
MTRYERSAVNVLIGLAAVVAVIFVLTVGPFL